MNNTSLKLFTGSVLLSALIFTGCGDGNPRNSGGASTLQPHQITTRTSSSNGSNWYKDVSISSTYDRTDENDHKFSINTVFNNGLSSDIAHIHFYVDADNDANTGFSNYNITGADYLLEDGVLFESQSDTQWSWKQIGETDYQTIGNKIKISGASGELMSITDIDNIKNLNISIGAVNSQWEDVGNHVSLQNVKIDVVGEGDTPIIVDPDPIIDPDPIVDPDPIIDPDPVNPDETLYEDAENGLADWYRAAGQYSPQRRTPGYNNSQAFVKLKTDWIQLGADSWKNRSEYHLLMDNQQDQTILSVDLVGDGEEMHHYILGVHLKTAQGDRRLMWDSFYNHENIPAERIVDANGIVVMIFPSPVEMVRGYGFADVNLNENFRVDLEAALRQFEPNNEILSVETFFATGGNLDNIKLISQ